MEKDVIRNAALFKGLTDAEIKDALKSLGSKKLSFQKEDFILSAGEVTNFLGLLLKGSATIENNDVWGNRTILSNIKQGQFFAETYALLPNEPLAVDVIANTASEVLFIDVSHLSKPDVMKTSWGYKMIYNLLKISTGKNIILSRRSFHTAQKTIRGKVMAYLASCSLQVSSQEFDIPFDRQQLADYLNVDRTALSKELGKMKAEGLIYFKKNHFKILDRKFTDLSDY